MTTQGTSRNIAQHREAGFAPDQAVELETLMASAEAAIQALLGNGDFDAAAALAADTERMLLDRFAPQPEPTPIRKDSPVTDDICTTCWGKGEVRLAQPTGDGVTFTVPDETTPCPDCREDSPVTEIPAIGTQVRFRPDFGAVGAAGLVFTVDTEPSVDGARADGQRLQMVGLKIRNANGRWGYRLAYVRDLVPASKPAEG